MRHLAAVLTALLPSWTGLSLHPVPTAAQVAAPVEASGEPGSELRVWLLTAAPGDAVWERFGHNAIRVLDTATGRDVAYNWGIFDFDQVDFVPRFLKGQMLYMMAPFRTGPMVESYARANREVVAQELDLTPAQRLALRDAAERNALPENRDYFYDYFLDNCSTRVRDLLNAVLGGALLDRFGNDPTETTWRYHTRRLTQMDPLLFTGMDLLLGTPGDALITTWEEMFLPMTLRDALRTMTVDGPDGVARPLVRAEEVVVPSTRSPDPVAPPSWLGVYLALGLVLGAHLVFAGLKGAAGSRWARVYLGVFGAVWSLVGGLVGVILVLVLFTDHQFMVWNENLFLFNPAALGLALLAPLSLRRAGRRSAARAVALFVLGVGLLGLVLQIAPAARQQNAIFFASMLPVHLGLAFALHRMLGDEQQDGPAPETRS